MVTIYQIQLTRDEVDWINSGVSLPKGEAYFATMTFGSRRWNKENFKHYVPAYEILTDDLEEAFEATNLWNKHPITDVLGDRGHSSSVGDIFEKDGTYYMCDSVGFTEVEVVNV